ncbi:hypothetical protein RHMOL_Rhmol08G0128600 [Rhododendron molle]|uniref:Uncharacterized protein n=1 Tax=Rhododendron molle TaxID=49168 RepID=A0ACC0MN27_RHOML|nr:hypothetical protein RHMOL_Rhmol08G0128600 [Rhododendron molle]
MRFVRWEDTMRLGISCQKQGMKVCLFSNLKWPQDVELVALVKRLYSLLTIKDSAANVPRNLEARRRLEFFKNSLFMNMPPAKLVHEMLSFSLAELQKKNEDGISILFYLQKMYPDEWRNFLARIGRNENSVDSDLFDSPSDILELLFWASYRGQTLARTLRGMMYYRKALMLQTYLERTTAGDMEAAVYSKDAPDTQGFELSREARVHADLKFTYVVTCQIYGKQKEENKPEAADIALLMQRQVISLLHVRNEALQVAFIDVVETLKDGRVHTEYYSKLVKADINGKDKEIYSIKLPGNPKLGEGKPENQNHAVIFTRGNAVQTLDMNQDNYFQEALKMRNLLEELHCDHGIRPATILGAREHVFTGRVFHITRGGISKASRVINISEDIFQVGKGRDVGLNQIALFEGKVAGGNGEQILSQDVYRLGQLFDFFQMMSFYFTIVGYYFCTMVNPDRALLTYVELTVLTVYIFLYGKAYLALSGVGEDVQSRAEVMDNAALNAQFLFQIGIFTTVPMILGFILEQGFLRVLSGVGEDVQSRAEVMDNAALNAQFLFQIGIFTAVPMILGFIVEQGFLRAVVSLSLCSFSSVLSSSHSPWAQERIVSVALFTMVVQGISLQYQATGRGFVVRHVRFAENYRLYSRRHLLKSSYCFLCNVFRLEDVLLLVVYLACGYNQGGALSYILLSLSSWFMALSWLFAPYLFNPSGFEWQKTVEDFRDWTNWLLYRGGIGVMKGQESWEAWWDEELVLILHLDVFCQLLTVGYKGIACVVFPYKHSPDKLLSSASQRKAVPRLPTSIADLLKNIVDLILLVLGVLLLDFYRMNITGGDNRKNRAAYTREGRKQLFAILQSSGNLFSIRSCNTIGGSVCSEALCVMS